jgi:hypothetical protein
VYEVLIHLFDRGYEDEVNELFEGNRDFEATVTYDIPGTIATASEELMDLVLLWPADVNKAESLLKSLKDNDLKYLPVIALIENKDQAKELLSLQITDYMVLPIPRKEFFAVLNETVKDLDVQSTVMEGMNWQGSLKEYNLIDLIQMVEDVKNDAELILSSNGKTARVYFKEGKLVHAELLNLSGELVLHKLIFWSKGNFQIKFSRQVSLDSSIESANQDILLTLAHDFSEWDKHYRDLPDLFEEIVVIPFTTRFEQSALQRQILAKCEHPISIFDLLLILREENTVIIQELKKLFEANLVGKRHEVELLVAQQQSDRGFSKIINTIASVFKKKEESAGIENIELYGDSGNFEEKNVGINFEHFHLAKEEKENIIKKIEALI